MCVFHVNGPNRFGVKSIGIGLKCHVNLVNKCFMATMFNFTAKFANISDNENRDDGGIDY